MLREDLAPARLADLVAGAADALQAAATPRPATRPGRRGRPRPCRCRARGCSWRRCARSAPRFSSSSIDDALLARQRAVVGLDQLARRARRRRRPLLVGQLVEPGGQPLGQPAGVDEDDRGAVLRDQLEQPRVHGRPDDCAHRARRRPGPLTGSSMTSPSAPMSSTGTTTSISSGLRMPASTMVTGRGAPGAVAAAEEPGDLLERALGGRQPDALRRPRRRSPRAARARAPGGRRAWWRPARGSRR